MLLWMVLLTNTPFLTTILGVAYSLAAPRRTPA